MKLACCMRSGSPVVYLGVSLFLTILGAKLWTIYEFGSDMPFWDQWPGEAVFTFFPWFEGQNFLSHLFGLHNEHRIAPTRVLSLTLLLVSGQWDPRVQCAVNACIHAAIVVLAFWWISRRAHAGWLAVIAAVLAVLFGCPIGWEDVLSGFQSQYYFLIGLALCGIGGCLSYKPFSAGWCISASCCFVSIVTMGSGMLCAAPLLFIAALKLALRPAERRDALANFGLGLLVALLGAYLYVPAPHHVTLRPQTVLKFLDYFVRCLAWPNPKWPWLAAVFWLPWIVVGVTWLRNFRARPDRTHDVLVGVGIWILAQAAAVSYSRGGASVLPSVRYGDVTGLGVPLGLFSVAILAPRFGPPARIFGGIYACLAIVTAAVVTREVITRELPRVRREFKAYEANVQAFMLTDDLAMLKENAIPFPEAAWLADLLRKPLVQRISPVCMRKPIAVNGLSDRDDARLPHRRIRRIESNARWQSDVLPAGSGWWKIETVGHIGKAGASLTLVSADNGAVLDVIAPSKSAESGWRAAYVRAPREPARFVAVTSGTAWLALSEPIEMSNTSYRVFQLCKESKYIFYAGLCGLVFAIGTAVVSLRRSPENGSSR